MVDGSEIRLITWYGKYPRIYQVLYIQQVIVWDFWTINSKQLDSITHTSSIHEYMIFLATNILLILLVNVGKYHTWILWVIFYQPFFVDRMSVGSLQSIKSTVKRCGGAGG